MTDFPPGDRIYVNPLPVCGSPGAFSNDHNPDYERMIHNGYLGIKPGSFTLFETYKYVGNIPAPQGSLILISDNLDFNTSARQ